MSPRMTRREALQGGSAAAVAVGSGLLMNVLTQRAKAATLEPKIELGDATADPTSNGMVTRNGADVKVYSGGGVKNMSDIGGGALSDSGTDTDGGDDYQLPNAADNIDLQGDGEIQDAQAVTAEDLDVALGDPVDESASRSTSTWYQNTTGNLLIVNATFSLNSGSYTLRVIGDRASTQTANGLDQQTATSTSDEGARSSARVVVPDQHYYQVRTFGDTSQGSMQNWYEVKV